MIDGLKPYSDYTESEVPWFGMIPSHWSLKRLGSVFAERGETNERREVSDVLSLLKDRGVIPYAEKGRIGNKASEDIGRYKIVRPDDLVMNCMNVIIGSVGRSNFTGCLSPVYYVLVRRREDDNPRFLEHLFLHKPFHQSLVRIGNGILAHRMRIPMEKLKSEMLPLPPPDEQAAIVKFLDYANGKIERAIRAKRKLIGLLNEQKQAIIHRAVTRGLDPTVKLKPSGIPWIGDVPEHWEVRRAKYLFKEVDERSKTGEEELLSVSHITGVTPRSEKNITMFKAASYVGSKMCRPDDLVINTMWAWMAALGSSTRHGIVSSAYGVYRPLRQRVIFGRYIEALLHTPHYMADILFRSTGIRASRLRLYPEEFLKMPVTLPPYEEQVAMFQWADSETKHLSSAIVRADHEIELLQEYRTTLTAEVVTGKLDVREAAKRLPDQTDEPLPPDESLEDLVDDEITEEDEA